MTSKIKLPVNFNNNFTNSGGTRTEEVLLTIPLSINFTLEDNTEQIAEYVEEIKKDSNIINPLIDYDKKKFSFTGNTLGIKFNFGYSESFGIITNGWTTDYSSQGFSIDSASPTFFFRNYKKPNFNKSFFVLDYLSSSATTNQKLLHRTVLNTFNGKILYNVSKPVYYSEFVSSGNTSGYNIFISNDNLESITDTIFLKAYFFNAKTGNIVNFSKTAYVSGSTYGYVTYNHGTSNTYNESEDYFILKIDKSNYTYRFSPQISSTTISSVSYPTIEFYRLLFSS